MHTKPRFIHLTLSLVAFSCFAPAVKSASIVRSPQSSAVTLADSPLAAQRAELLQLAFDAASALPSMPHAKNRARLQEDVVDACLELDQPLRARGYIERIEGWRRGSGYADLALWCARKGATDDAQRSITLAREIADQALRESEEIGDGQSWRHDRIKGRIAAVLALLGRKEDAHKINQGIDAVDAAPLHAVEAAATDAEGFDSQLGRLASPLASGNLDEVKLALGGMTRLYDRFYDDAKRRDIVEQRLREMWGNVPLLLRFEVGHELATHALAHGDKAKALELATELRALADAPQAGFDTRVPLRARSAALLARAGDAEAARKQVDAALAEFDAQRARLADIDRADVLRVLAEAYAAVGARDQALATYLRAADAGVENPNSRPRAEDLVATCCSLAKLDLEPTPELFARLSTIRKDLREPW